jgi:hypothetical protein
MDSIPVSSSREDAPSGPEFNPIPVAAVFRSCRPGCDLDRASNETNKKAAQIGRPLNMC